MTAVAAAGAAAGLTAIAGAAHPGFTPYYLRLGPHTVFTFLILEQLNRLYKDNVLSAS